MMATLSLCMIVKNEEDTLARCLDSVKDIVDEIVIVDTGSTDRTKEIALHYTEKIYDFKWINDFSAARNYSYKQATMEYIMWLDADDVILPEDQGKLLELKDNRLNSLIDGVMMKYNTAFDQKGNVTFSYYRERITKRERGFEWKEPVHECIQLYGNIINVDIAITHRKIKASDPGRNLKIYEEIVKTGTLSPRGIYYYARELRENNRFEEAIGYFNEFLQSGKGWVEDNIGACTELAKCYWALGDSINRLNSLLRSFHYDTPRAEVCCDIGYFFKEKKEYDRAIFWFELVLNLKKPKDCWGFVLEDTWGYIPCIELCVCHYEKGDLTKAIFYNNLAGKYKPNDSSFLINKELFDRIYGIQKP